MPTGKELKELIDQMGGDNAEFAYSLWQVEDVKDYCKTNNIIELTDEECKEVISIMHENYDASYGMTWTLLGCAIEDLLSNKGGN